MCEKNESDRCEKGHEIKIICRKKLTVIKLISHFPGGMTTVPPFGAIFKFFSFREGGTPTIR
jgi:hypothetical protein